MIVSFRDAWLRAFFVEDIRSRNIPPDLEARLFRRLQMLDDAATDRDLRCRLATTSRSCMAVWRGFVRSALTGNGG
jgi:plasmid maintenance system killer protein